MNKFKCKNIQNYEGHKNKIFKVFFIFMPFLALCACRSARKSTQDEHDAVVSRGYSSLPIAELMHKQLGGWSFITHWNIPNDARYGLSKNEKIWQTITYVHNRYELTYVQTVEITGEGGEVVRPIGEPKLIITEIASISGDQLAPGGRYGSLHVEIGKSEIAILTASKFDFSKIGLDLIADKPVQNIKWKFIYWNKLYPNQTSGL